MCVFDLQVGIHAQPYAPIVSDDAVDEVRGQGVLSSK
jgi:hypothetical protein